ncbi:hypothetical protein [Candidatus Burkholderia verschuerenii]|uniref:hypothetical protein n=1 Tax=Candidatus Burkholderia verschuerenii TaxID=242163 RepID=UPI000AB2C4D0|nr:hypothetical protein [Candidatus Burkholderia verschuerenii]
MKLLSWRLDPANAAKLAEFYAVPVPSPLVWDAGNEKVRKNWPNNPTNVKVAFALNTNYWGEKAQNGMTNEEYLQQRLNQLLAK